MVKNIIGIFFLLLLCNCTTKEKKEHASKDTASTAGVSKANRSIGDVPIYDFDGLEPLLHRKDDKTYIINFWATWCAPCIKELPYFEKINSEQKDNNVEVILVSLDMPKMWESQLIPFIAKKDLKSKVVILDDPKQNSWIPKVDKDWSGAIPATIIYNRDKRSFFEQSFSYDELKSSLGEFLEQ
ncbi:MAG: redoxin domain-containing protein [Saonia sp.]